MALLRALKVLDKVSVEGDEKFGIEALRRALSQPLERIAENAGFDGAVVARRVLKEKNVAYGFNAMTGEYQDLFIAGVVDPTKVTRTALQNALSVGTLLLSTDAIITEKPKEENQAKGAAATTTATWTWKAAAAGWTSNATDIQRSNNQESNTQLINPKKSKTPSW